MLVELRWCPLTWQIFPIVRSNQPCLYNLLSSSPPTFPWHVHYANVHYDESSKGIWKFNNHITQLFPKVHFVWNKKLFDIETALRKTLRQKSNVMNLQHLFLLSLRIAKKTGLTRHSWSKWCINCSQCYLYCYTKLLLENHEWATDEYGYRYAAE